MPPTLGTMSTAIVKSFVIAALGLSPLLALPVRAQQAILVPTENIRIEYGQVLRAEPIYETQRETWLERQCPEGNKMLSRIAGAVKDVLKRGESGDGRCKDVPVEREFRRLAAYEVDYMYKGSKFRSRMPYDPGNRIKLRISVMPHAVAP